MKTLRNSISLFVVLALGAAAFAADPKPRVSPPGNVEITIGSDPIKITYSRPYIKDPKTGAPRKIWGGLVPYGKVWRTGANEATVLTTQKNLMFGATAIPAGSYSLWTLPAGDGSAQLIFNKQIGQWGTKYDASQDFAKIDLQKSTLTEVVDPFTIAVKAKGTDQGALEFSWENTSYAAPFSVQP